MSAYQERIDRIESLESITRKHEEDLSKTDDFDDKINEYFLELEIAKRWDIVLKISGSIGFVMMLMGFFLWHIKVQRHLDKFLLKQVKSTD